MDCFDLNLFVAILSATLAPSSDLEQPINYAALDSGREQENQPVLFVTRKIHSHIQFFLTYNTINMETVLVVGASGNIGVSTIIAALRSGRSVLAIVRNKAAQEKITKNVPDVSKVTFVEADVVNDKGVQGVVDQVKAGKLPAFQHVYAAGAQLLISANFRREITN